MFGNSRSRKRTAKVYCGHCRIPHYQANGRVLLSHKDASAGQRSYVVSFYNSCPPAFYYMQARVRRDVGPSTLTMKVRVPSLCSSCTDHRCPPIGHGYDQTVPSALYHAALYIAGFGDYEHHKLDLTIRPIGPDDAGRD